MLSAGVTSEHVALALQLAVAMAVACTLHVCRPSYEALKEKTIWTVVTGARSKLHARGDGQRCTLQLAGSVRHCLRRLQHRAMHLVLSPAVAVILESAVGGLVLKSALRVVGTCGAGLLGMG